MLQPRVSGTRQIVIPKVKQDLKVSINTDRKLDDKSCAVKNDTMLRFNPSVARKILQDDQRVSQIRRCVDENQAGYRVPKSGEVIKNR